MTVHTETILGTRAHYEAGELVEAENRVIARLSKSGGFLFKRAMELADVPKAGDPISNEDQDVRAEEHSIRVVGLSEFEATVQIDIVYRRQRPEVDQTSISGGASLQQIRTQRDRNGEPIVVSYEGEGYVAEADVLAFQGTFERELTLATTNPDAIVNEWIGKRNSLTFRGGQPGTWIVSNVRYRLVNKEADPPRYDFNFQFERSANPEGWTVTVAYKDPETQQIPEDVVEGVGLVEVDWFEDKDYSTMFA